MLYSDDTYISRVACGLVSDLTSYLEIDFLQFCDNFMGALDTVLRGNEFNITTKTHAIIAIGDICLAIGQGFFKYYDSTIACLMDAAKITLEPQNFESEEDL